MARLTRTREHLDLSHLDRAGLVSLVHDLRAQIDLQQNDLDRQAARLAELESALPAAAAGRSLAGQPAPAPAAPPKKKTMKPAAGAAFTIVFDGGSINNPGRGYGSYQIVDSAGVIAKEAALDYGMGVSNNAAEYRSLIAALEAVIAVAGDRVKAAKIAIRGDSQLVIRQVKGEWKVNKDDLKPLHARVRELLAQLGPVDLQWHGRANSVRILGH